MKHYPNFLIPVVLIFQLAVLGCNPAPSSDWPGETRMIPVGSGWAQSSVNAVIFRQNSIISRDSTQFISWYNAEGRVMLAKRRIGQTDESGEPAAGSNEQVSQSPMTQTELTGANEPATEAGGFTDSTTGPETENSIVWEITTTPYFGDVTDAHNAISIALDGEGYLHMVWGLHNNPMMYVKSLEPGGMTLSDPLPMTGQNESAVTYPQFYFLPDGDLLFSYREGGSGNGNVMLNRYDVETGDWNPLQHPLIDGEGERNAYINPIAIDRDGNWHLSWNWRDTPDVASNHDIVYTWSPDEGATWLNATGEVHPLPITFKTAGVVREIPQNSDLINQTSMTVDPDGNPFIVTYWRPDGSETPQYHFIWRESGDQTWRTSLIGNRTEPFSLSGYNTRRIPLSRPLVLSGDDGRAYVIFRDFERSGGVTLAAARPPDYADWEIAELDTQSVGLWEPTYDPVAWQDLDQLHLFHQKVGQGDNETLEDIPPQPVSILEWHPF